MSDTAYRSPIKIDLHTAMGDPTDAQAADLPDERTLRKLLEHRQIDPSQLWHMLGYRRYLERDFQGAVMALNQALLHDPRRSESHFLKGICLQLLGLAEAETYPGFPKQVPARAYGMLSKAQWAFRITLELNPQDEEARTYLQGLEALLR